MNPVEQELLETIKKEYDLTEIESHDFFSQEFDDFGKGKEFMYYEVNAFSGEYRFHATKINNRIKIRRYVAVHTVHYEYDSEKVIVKNRKEKLTKLLDNAVNNKNMLVSINPK